MSEETRVFYQKLINSQLQQAYELLLPKIKIPDFLNSTLETLVSQQTPQHLRLNILILLRPVLEETWMEECYEEIKNDIRSTLLHGVVENSENIKIVEAYAVIIRDIIIEDGVEGWVEPLEQLVKWAEGEQPKSMEAGIDFFLTIFQDSMNTQIYKLSSTLLSSLFQMFASSEICERVRQKILILVLLVIRSFSSFDGNQDNIVNECFGGSYDTWMSLFLSALQGELKSHLTMKRYILKSLTIIFRDMLRLSSKSLQNCLFPIWQFCYKVSHLYIWNVVFKYNLQSFQSKKPQKDTLKNKIFEPIDLKYLTEDIQNSFQNQVQALAHQAVEFLSTIVSIPALFQAVKVSSYHIVGCLYNFMLLSRFQISNWTNNPQLFMPYLHNSEDISTLRSKAISIVNELIQKYDSIAIQAVLLISEKFLLDHSQSETTKNIKQIYDKLNIKPQPGIDLEKVLNLVVLSSYDLNVSSYSWRKVEVALAVLGRFSEDIIVFQSKNQTSFDIQSFIGGLMKQIEQPTYFQLLKGQALLCITRYVEIISIKHKEMFPQLLKTSCSCVGPDNQIPVRTIAMRSFSMFSRKIQKYALPVDENFFIENRTAQEILSITITYQTLIHLIEVLIELCKLSKSQRSVVAGFGDYILSIFKLSGSATVTNQIFTLLSQIANQKQEIEALYKHFGDFINQWLKAFTKVLQDGHKEHLKPADVELTRQVFRLLELFVDKGKQITFQNIRFLPEFLQVNDDAELHVAATLCLKNYIKVASASIIKNNFTPKILQVIHSLLQVPKDKSFQAASLYAGNMIILTFNNLLNGVVDLEILRKLVLKVFKSRTPSIIQSLILVYARIINSSGDQLAINRQKLSELVEFLGSFSIENRMALKILVDKWLLQQSLFRGKHTKCATFMALAKLFLLKDKKIENLLVIGFNPSHSNVNSDVEAPLKILSTLIRCLGNECTKDLPLDSTNANSVDDQDQPDFQGKNKQDNQVIDVQMQKFKDEQEPTQNKERVDGGLADRQNQGSTCYMSAMLQFYDDGQQCDQTTQDDLEYLQDASTKVNLVQFLKSFFIHEESNDTEYFNSRLKGLLKQDVSTLNRHVKLK